MVNPEIGKLKGKAKEVKGINTLGGSFVLPPSVKPTAEQKKQVTQIKKDLKKKQEMEKKKSATEVKKWADKQYKKGKLSGGAWSEYKHKVM